MKNLFETAKWIWQESACGVNETVDFMTEFTAEKADTYEILISVQSHYGLWLNGEFVDCDQFQDFTFYKVYDRFPLKVKEGVNTLQVLAYCQGDGSSTVRPAPGGLIFEIYNGEKLVAASDTQVKCRRNTHYASEGVEWVSGQITYSFRYDATTEENAWENAVVRDHDWPLNPRPIKKMYIDEPMEAKLTARGYFVESKKEGTIAQQMQAAAITAEAPIVRPVLPSADGVDLEGNFALIDLGKEVVGYYYMDIEVPEACDIHIGWGEHVEDLRVRTRIGGRNFAALYKAHAGRNIFFYPIKKMGLRYVQLHVHLNKENALEMTGKDRVQTGIKLHYAGVRPSHYPYDQVNLFTCADRLHAQIYRICMRTLQGCMHEHYEDCPWREQALYAMDSRNQMLIGYYTFDEYEFAKASLHLMAKSIRPDHLIELMSPGEWPERTIPSFSSFHLIQLGEYLQYSGDVEFIKEILPAAIEIAAEFIDRIEDNGLIAQFKGKQYWNFFEWQVGLDGGKHVFDTEYAAPLAALMVMAFEQMAKMCVAVAETEFTNCTEESAFAYDKAELLAKAESYTQYAENMKAAIHKYFWQEEKGYYASFIRDGQLCHACELTQALALMCGAVPAELQDQVLETLTGNMGADFYPVTLSTCLYKYEALLQKPEKYGRFVFDQVADIFGGMLYKDATTFWETEDGACAFNNAGSLCHGWSAIPAYLYMRYCLDSKGEGTKLPEKLTGIYEPDMKVYKDASRNVLDDKWD